MSEQKVGGAPSFIAGLPSWVQFLWPIFIAILSSVAPLLEGALPEEAALIQEVIIFLNGGPAGPKMMAARAVKA
jgi:hypothetical protein